MKGIFEDDFGFIKYWKKMRPMHLVAELVIGNQIPCVNLGTRCIWPDRFAPHISHDPFFLYDLRYDYYQR